MPQREDDPSITDDEVLWRRIIPSWIHREPGGKVRPGSVAFLDRLSGELSVHIASLTTPEQALKDRPDDSLVAIPAGYPRSLGFAIVRDPKPDDPSHALICPSPKGARASKLAEKATWVVFRGGPSPPG
jgi:hypothetical protein